MDSQEVIKNYYQQAFDQYGDTPKGLAWQNKESMDLRFEVMLNLIKEDSVSLLDFGCGTGKLLDYLLQNRNLNISKYYGVDVNQKVIDYCNNLYPNQPSRIFLCKNILIDELPICDYTIVNGVFTVKDKLSWQEMWNYFTLVIKKLFDKTNKGIAFNLMSKHVDWEREDLFHVPLDTLANFLTKELTRNYVIRNDYKLYEFTTYVYK